MKLFDWVSKVVKSISNWLSVKIDVRNKRAEIRKEMDEEFLYDLHDDYQRESRRRYYEERAEENKRRIEEEYEDRIRREEYEDYQRSLRDEYERMDDDWY